MELKPYQQRVVDEKKELDVKRDKLTEFFKGKTFANLDSSEKSRLSFQASIMLQYSNILADRIAAFT